MENTLIEYVKVKKAEIAAFNLANFAKSLTGGENVDKNNTNEWINCDANNLGFEHLTDKQIV